MWKAIKQKTIAWIDPIMKNGIYILVSRCSKLLQTSVFRKMWRKSRCIPVVFQSVGLISACVELCACAPLLVAFFASQLKNERTKEQITSKPFCVFCACCILTFTYSSRILLLFISFTTLGSSQPVGYTLGLHAFL